MTVTDDERREVAARLRANAKAHPHMGLLLNFAFADKGLNPDGEMEYNVTSYHAALRLADFIEPEPERMCSINADWYNGDLEHSVYRCSACGAVMLDDACYFDGSSDLDWFHYCPNCGAKVTEVGQ